MNVDPVQVMLPDIRGPQLARLGVFLRRHQMPIVVAQWVVVLGYFALVAIPVFLPLPSNEAHIWNNFSRFAQFVFWGIWWPFVIVSIMAFGRLWCGLFCPEGALSEWVSRYGLGRGIPRWMKWAGWPFVTFIATAVFGQMVSLHEYPKPALLILGGSTVAAVTIGLLYGRAKRVWCRHLCPVAGVFALLAKVAPIHFQVDRSAWDSAPAGSRTSHHHAVNCAPLIDIRRMESASECHMCGRCAGERGAVHLALRSPNAEILNISALLSGRKADETTRWLARLLVFGMIGVALGSFQWSVSPWFADARHALTGWLTARKIFWPLSPPGHWWILAYYPKANDVFNWLDGGLLFAYIAAEALILGVWIIGWMRFVGAVIELPWQRFAYVLIPFGGASLFVGSSFLTTSQLAASGVLVPWAREVRIALLLLATLWSAVLAWRMAPRRRLIAAVGTLTAAALPLAAWAVEFFVW
ncbi:MAG: 4Fe-4S binding protein [Acidiferrobacterales bacterium]